MGAGAPLRWVAGVGAPAPKVYEIISGAALAFAALLLILPGFATDILGLLIIFPPTRKLFLKNVSMKYSQRNQKKQDFINGEFEEIDDENDRKL